MVNYIELNSTIYLAFEHTLVGRYACITKHMSIYVQNLFMYERISRMAFQRIYKAIFTRVWLLPKC